MSNLIITKKEGYTIVQMNRGKVNAINRDMVRELKEAFEMLEADADVKGVILSGQPHYFSAGLDLIELFQYDKDQIQEFFSAFGALYLQLVQFSPWICD